MRILLLSFLITSIMFGQKINYPNLWKNVESAEKKGDFKSNLSKVKEILTFAEKENNTKEELKAMYFLSKIKWQTEDEQKNTEKEVFDLFKNKIETSKGTSKVVHQIALANLYHSYFQANRWNLRDITSTEKPSDDYKTWNEEKYYQTITQLYEEAFFQKENLKNEKIANWEYVLSNKGNHKIFPTLYDFIAYDYLTKLDNYNFSDEISESKKNIRTKFYKELIDFHKNDTEKSSFLYWNQLDILKKEQDNRTKKEIVKELEQLALQYKNQEYSTELLSVAGNLVFQENPKEAYRLAKLGISDFPKSSWTINCEELIKTIEGKSIHIEYNEQFLEGTPIPMKITHKNVNKISIKFFQAHPEITNTNQLEFNGNLIVNKNHTFIKEQKINLKTFDDFKSHSTLFALDELPKGTYILKATDETNNEVQFTTSIQISDYSIVKTLSSKEPHQKIFKVINRNTGKDYANTSFELWKLNINYNDNVKITTQKITNIQTDHQGEFSHDFNNQDYNSRYVLIQNGYCLSIFPEHHYREPNETQPNETVSFFTDRAIYRPGQKVFFKGIFYTQHKGKSTINKNQNVEVRLKNTNGEEVSKLNLTTNDFGSVFGEFILPNSGLNGNYTLETDYGSHDFQVEEYKRPKFEVTFDKEKQKDKSFKLNEKAIIDGKALSFAGTTISDAKVTYRITREEVYLYYRCWWFPRYENPEEITNGTTKTDGEGNFSIDFIAESSKRNEQKLKNRSFTYKIFVDVIDKNGETRSGETSITIGDLPKKLGLVVNEKSLQKDFKKIEVISTNLNDVKTPSKGTLTIKKLKNPTEHIVLPNQDLDEVEYQLLDETTFRKKLPFYSYHKETNKEKWKTEKVVFTSDFDTEKTGEILLNKTFEKGTYLVEALTMFGKDSIQTQKIVEIADDKTLQTSDDTFFEISQEKQTYKVGETATLTFLTDLKDAYVNIFVESDDELITKKLIYIKDGKATENILIKPEYVQGVFVRAILMKHNGIKEENTSFSVIEKPRKLNITTKTFRSKIEPGSQQNWELTISGEDKDKFLAEVLATMYDASLDEFRINRFSFSPFSRNSSSSIISSWLFNWNDAFNNSSASDTYRKEHKNLHYLTYFDWNTFGFHIAQNRRYAMKTKMMMDRSVGFAPVAEMKGGDGFVDLLNEGVAVDSSAVALYEENDKSDERIMVEAAFKTIRKNEKQDLSNLKVRTNFNETAFFYPNLKTDEQGNVKLSFTTPESLTKWKMLVLAHTQELQSGTAEFFTQTQKQLMVNPNVPRFLRENDELIIKTKIDNLSDKTLDGTAQLFLSNALNNENLDEVFVNIQTQKSFSVDKNKATEVSWKIKIPKSIQAVTWKIVAQAGDFSDGEESILPILANRMLVTETIPISVKENQTKIFTLEKLKNQTSNTLENFNLTAELTANPTWLALYSLPYLREYPHECSEQLFSRIYGNMLSTYILNKSPKIKKVFDVMNSKDLLISNLEKNPELKNILLNETPWVREAQSETEKMKRIALFFDLNTMSNELAQAQTKLLERQMQSGGFPWFDGGREDFYITNHLIAGFGKLKKMLGKDASNYLKEDLDELISKAISYSDKEAIRILEEAKKRKEKNNAYLLSNYFYSRSYWLERKIPAQLQNNLNDYLKEIAKLEHNSSSYQKGMSALILQRFNKIDAAKKLVHSLKETAVESEEMGMYWKDNVAGWYWYNAPIEAQATIIEAFSEVSNDVNAVEEQKIWLLKNKQTNAWNTTKSTTDAVYVLMTFGKSYLESEKGITMKVGNEVVYPTLNPTLEEEAGFVKKSWKGKDITSEKAIVTIEKKSPGVAYGGLFWQYFEDLDKITTAQNKEINFEKKLYLKQTNEKGEILKEITENYPIKIGDKVTVKLVIRTNRDMEYVHLKDMRASGFEPLNVISTYKYQNGTGYYESTKDASTNFFFSYLPKGTYNFEYDLRANNSGNFSNGITQLQCMYAPEMSAHSEGIRVNIE
jgi:uncharacterized protein YfaS (alpha-2-macroglobulin family)